VVGGDVFDDRQPQPGAPGGAAARLVDAEEPLEHLFLMLEGDAQAAVGDGDLRKPFFSRLLTDTGLPDGE